jgi:hypothetical protein
MRQTVVLLHTQPNQPDHYDWLIDQPELSEEHRLITFRTTARPDQPGKLIAQKTPNHRAFYLTHQGPLTNNRGRVVRVAAGHAHEWSQTESTIQCLLNWGIQTYACSAERQAEATDVWHIRISSVQGH